MLKLPVSMPAKSQHKWVDQHRADSYYILSILMSKQMLPTSLAKQPSYILLLISSDFSMYSGVTLLWARSLVFVLPIPHQLLQDTHPNNLEVHLQTQLCFRLQVSWCGSAASMASMPHCPIKARRKNVSTSVKKRMRCVYNESERAMSNHALVLNIQSSNTLSPICHSQSPACLISCLFYHLRTLTQLPRIQLSDTGMFHRYLILSWMFSGLAIVITVVHCLNTLKSLRATCQ